VGRTASAAAAAGGPSSCGTCTAPWVAARHGGVSGGGGGRIRGRGGERRGARPARGTLRAPLVGGWRAVRPPAAPLAMAARSERPTAVPAPRRPRSGRTLRSAAPPPGCCWTWQWCCCEPRGRPSCWTTRQWVPAARARAGGRCGSWRGARPTSRAAQARATRRDGALSVLAGLGSLSWLSRAGPSAVVTHRRLGQETWWAASKGCCAPCAVALLTLDGAWLLGRVDALCERLRLLGAGAAPSKGPVAAGGGPGACLFVGFTAGEDGRTRCDVLPQEEAQVRLRVWLCGCGGCAHQTFLRHGAATIATARQGSAGAGVERGPRPPEPPASHPPSQALARALKPLLVALEPPPSSPPAASVPSTGPPPSALGHAGSASGGQVVEQDLARLPGLPLQPTLQGVLLGYPLVFAIHSMRDAERASRLLAVEGLVLCRAELALLHGSALASELARLQQEAVAARGAEPGRAGARGRRAAGGALGPHGTVLPHGDVGSVCAFSVPASLWGDEGGSGVQSIVAAFAKRIEAAVGARMVVQHVSSPSVVL
jgi:hypothetical protein